MAPGADGAQSKAAFRRLALVRHPDRNGNSPGSHTAFLVLLDAYRTLSDPDRQRDYDHYLGTRSPRRTEPTRTTPRRRSDFDNRLKSLLWDLEDLVVRHAHGRPPVGWDRRTSDQALGRVLRFWDRWILVPAGFPDYFFEAQRIAPGDPPPGGHRPYTSVENEFYDVRKRMNRALGVLERRDLTQPVEGTTVPWIEALLEAQALAVHTVGALERIWAGTASTVPPFPASRPEFA